MPDADLEIDLSPVLQSEHEFQRLVDWVGTTVVGLQDRLDRVRAKLRGALTAAERTALGAVLERLQMLQIVETSLAVGDVLPEFALPDTGGRVVASEALLANGPMVLVFVRGTWCPYCSLALQALDAARPPIEALGGTLVVVSPMLREQLAKVAADRGLGLTLLSDADGAYARLCGVHYEMSDGHAALYQRFGLNLAQVNAGAGWALPIPATYVVDRQGVITFAHAEVDWARRAEPADIVAAVARLDPAADAG